MVIPAAESAQRPVLASAGKMSGGEAAPARHPPGTAATRRRSGVGAAKAMRLAPNEATSRPIGWIDAVNSQIGLKPVTMVSMKAVRHRSLEEEDDPRSQYKVIIPRDMRKAPAIVTKPAELARAGYSQGIRSYRQFLNVFAILFRRINEAAYGVSLVFVILAIVGAIMGKHSLVVTGISLVVLLNVVQLIAGIANLIVVQFRGNVVRGLLFLFPPVTAFNLWKNWYRWEKAIKRITSPIIWLVVVFVAYAYLPWLNGSKKGKTDWLEAVQTIKKDVSGTVSDIRQKASALEEKFPGELEKVNLDELKTKATATVGDLRTKAENAIDGNRAREKRAEGEPAKPPSKQAP